MVVAVIRGWWDIEGWVAIEEAGGFEGEADGFDRHNRPVFGAHHVIGAHRIPDHDISLLQRAVLLHIRRQAVASRLLVGIVTGCIPLCWIVGRHPEMVPDEAAALPLRRTVREERKRVLVRHELVGYRLS